MVNAYSRPNVMVILVDDLGYSDLECYGSEIRTPNINALAEQGLCFRNFYNMARCSPSRVALLTGLYPQQAAVDPVSSHHNLRSDNNVTMAEVLRDHGYETCEVGKWHIGKLDGDGTGPQSRGFDHFYATAGQTYWEADKQVLYSPDEVLQADPADSLDGPFYRTDACAEYSTRFIRHHARHRPEKPFFVYLALNAPHFPLEAPTTSFTEAPEGGISYLEQYARGWNVIRRERYDRMLQKGVIDSRYPLTPFSETPDNEGGEYWAVPDWDMLPDDRRADLSRRMAVYAGMIVHIDRAVGQLVDTLKDTGQLDNTLIFILSDNGGCAQGGVFGKTYGKPNGAALTGAELMNMGQPAGADQFLWLGGGWADVCNTPFRYYKRFCHGGGTRTPLIVHWPDGIAEPGRWSDQTGHIIDVMHTVADVAGVPCPETWSGREVLPWEGISLKPVFERGVMMERQIGFEHMSNRGWIDGDWKLVTKYFDSTNGLPAHTPELYNLADDPAETKNLAAKYPEKTEQMVSAWNQWARHVGLPSALQLKMSNPTAPPAEVGRYLFMDTFEREDCSDIDGDTGGLYGRLLPDGAANAIYFEGFEGTGRPDNIKIKNSTLRMSVGPGMSETGLMINFATPHIAECGGFSVEMDIGALQSNSSEPANRYAGFGVGLSREEAAAGGLAKSANSFREATADFFVGLDIQGNIQIWRKGELLQTLPIGQPFGQLKAVFYIQGFEAGETVEVSIEFDGREIGGSWQFSWDHSSQNYIGLSGRATGYVQINQLGVSMLPNQEK